MSGHLHICTGTNRRFVARVRLSGHRRYIVVGNPHRSLRAALVALAERFACGNYKRGDVLMTADYYDPISVAEITR